MKSCIVAGALYASAVTAVATPRVTWSMVRRYTDVDNACQAAVTALGSSKVDTQPLNQTLVTKNWSDTCVSQPYCIVQPASAADVAEVLEIITTYQVKFAVRSGGHSPNPGWSSVSGNGILIDMSSLDSVSLSADSSFATVGPGAYWGDVSTALDPSGVTVIGARAPYVGVGGMLLGGGYSYFASEYGMAVDNVKSYEVVLADSTIVNANAITNSDLFWALKGGGPNYGIVTKVELYTVPIPQMWYKAVVYLPSQAHDVLDALVEWQTNGASDEKAGMLISAALDGILVLLTYSSPVQNPAAFTTFLADVVPALEAIPSTISSLATLHSLVTNSFPALPGRHDYRGISSKIDAQLYKDVYDFWLEKATTVHASTGANQTFVIQHVSANVAQIGDDNGGNPLNLPQQDHQWWTTIADWEDAADDTLVRSVSIQTTDKWRTLSQARNLDIDFIYMNDASRDQNPIASYGAANVAQLKSIALLYDPDEVFQNLQNDGFLLRKV